MSGNNEGTPNPLNPGFGYPGAGAPREMPMSDADAPVDPMVEALGGFTEYNPVENTAVENMTTSSMPQMARAPRRATPSNSTMPQMASAPARPMRPAMRTNQPVIDPMMRHASREPVMVETVETVTMRSDYPYGDDGSNYSHDYSDGDYGGRSDDMAARVFRTEQSEYARQPVAQAAPADTAKPSGKSKKPLIITLMVLFMVALVCGVAALIIFVFPKSEDRMALAINRVLNGNMSSIVNAKGDITISNNDSSAQYSRLSIDLDATFDTNSSMQKADATITADLTSRNSIEFDISEIGTKNGTNYIKLGNVANALGEVLPPMGSTQVSGTTTAQPTVNAASNALMLGVFQTIENKWIMIPNTSSGEEFTSSLDSMGLFDNQTTCLTNVLMTIPTYGKDLVSKYKNNQFITYTTENVAIAKKRDALYKLGFDDTKLAAFINSLPNFGLANALNACVGNSATNQSISASDIAKIFSGYPDLYVEVDDKGNITRAYFDAALPGGMSTVKADLALSYPSELKITEPSEYLDANSIITQVMTAFFSGGNTNDAGDSDSSDGSGSQEVIIEEEYEEYWY